MSKKQILLDVKVNLKEAITNIAEYQVELESVVEAEKLERERKEEESKRRQEAVKQRREEELRSKMVTGVTQVGY